MLDLSVREVARAVAGTLRGQGGGRVAGVVTDSRKVRPGDLFVALKGARTDGHQYLRQALEAGAAAAVVEPDRGLRPPGLNVVIVPDGLRALAQLASHHLARLSAPIVGITGTVGKTTAKDFLAALLGGTQHAVHAAPASYNSECGLPLAILAAPLSSRFLVLEYGVNAPGEMERLLSIARPRHAWLTALTAAHLEGMGDLDTIVREKCLLARQVREDAFVWLPASLLARTAEERRAWCARVAPTGLDGQDGRGTVLEAAPGAFRVRLPELGELVLPVLAEHEAELAAAAAQAALQLGVSAEQVRARLRGLIRPSGRLTLHDLGCLRVIDDSYNASPAAMEAALRLLAGWPDGARRVAVLGTMHELGSAAESLHREVGRQLAALPVDLVFTVGRGGAWIAAGAREAGAPAEIYCADDAVAAATQVCRRLAPRDVVLLKGSRAEALEEMLDPIERAAKALRGAAVPDGPEVAP